MPDEKALRKLVARLLDWEDAHAGFDAAVADLPANLRGRAPDSLPYSPWQLLEHIRRTQADILEFCQADAYHEKEWPREYWPESAKPPSEQAWDDSVAAVRRDRKALAGMMIDSKTDLMAPVPNGTGQTYLREVLVVADHTAYHVGELIVVRRLLDAWPA